MSHSELPAYKRARRSQIVAAATAALKVGDYDQIQMRDIAEDAQVALGTLYRYFSSKEHVYAAVLQEWARPVFVAAETDDRSAEARVRAKVDTILSSFERWPGFFRVCMVLQNSTDPNATAIMAEFSDAAVQTLARDFAALGEQAAADAALMLWAIINTVLSAAILRGAPMADAVRISNAYVDLIGPRLAASAES
ncbi:TetR/AcrR family transcriptional regulator [[Mycobacterium] wendilense]|uniref:TetR family transcriptional regulator n=1 Tax=[Mycobacterium] wendilense TaxID=3064284 RepID=A0ABN9NZV2_9MYCO|nr:TetR family transcriptional regulator [Mycolicibacterium sp. MU0050]CAJ1583725.1 TetR family transcriptional regulator [Mycolicibacterium sp. MU0050]